MAGKFSVEGVFKMNDSMTAPIAKIEGRFERLQRRVGSSMSGLASGVGKAWGATEKWASGVAERARPLAALGGDLKTVGVAAAAAGAAAGAGLLSVMRTGMDYEKTMLDAGNKFEPGIKKNSALFQKLSKAAQEVGANTEFSSSQAAEGLNSLAGAGFNADQAVAALPKTVDFATAAVGDLAVANEVVAKSLGAYGLMTDDTDQLSKNVERITDTFMKTDALSSTSVTEIFEALKEGGPIAHSAGASIETFGAIVATLGNAGIVGSQAGTDIKDIFLSLAKPTTEATGLLTKFGVQTKDSLGNLRDPVAVLGDLSKATAKLGTADKAAVIEGIFGKIPIAAVNVLLGKVDELKKNRDELVNSKGQVKLVADSKRQSTQGSWDNLTSGLEAVSLGIFDVVGGPMKELIDSTTEWIGNFRGEAVPVVQEFLGSFKAGFAAAWPAIKGVMSMLFSGFGSKADWIGQVKVFATLLGKITAGAILFGATMAGMVAGGIQIATGLINEAIGAWNGMIDGIGAALFAVDDFFENLGAKWDAFDFGEWAQRMIDGLVNGIKNGASFVLDAIKDLGDAMVNKLKGVLSIHSPSKRTAEIGKFAAMGIGEGFKLQMPKVDQQIGRSVDVSAMVQPSLMQPPDVSRWTLPPINALPLGSDVMPAVARPQPQVVSGGAAAARPGSDRLEITVKATDGATAEVTKKPKSSLITLNLPRSGDE